jgi:hypothetical protein
MTLVNATNEAGKKIAPIMMNTMSSIKVNPLFDNVLLQIIALSLLFVGL